MHTKQRALLGFTWVVLLFSSCNGGRHDPRISPDGSMSNLPDSGLQATEGKSDTGGQVDTTIGAEAGATRSDTGIAADLKINGEIGQTEFLSEEPGARVGSWSDASVSGTGGSASMGGSTAVPSTNTSTSTTDNATKEAPSGRVAEVEEADIYKIDGTRLYYLNTYRGFLAFDIADPTNPKQLSRLPVYGYPIEMFVQGTTVFALLKDALYLTQVNGKPQFQRYNTSQLVTIDIADPANPKVIQTMDIVGQLREGVSRKIDNTIYVVSYQPQNYYYSGYTSTTTTKEQAWVYSFDVANPKVPKKVNELQIFEGGSTNFNADGFYYYKYFQNVALSATSNALMVVENWYVYTNVSSSVTGRCGAYESNQRAVVSVIDISDPKGTIRRHTRFETNGTISDQFKMTYVYDETAKTGTFYGIFGRSVWSTSGCMGTSFTQNSLESWDITNGDKPMLQSRLDFGKPNETVRGTAFDVTRKVAYAITAQRIDPLYALSYADPKNLKILSAVDGLSGDMSVFRLIQDRNFLIAVGTDTSSTCTGFDTTRGQGSQIAVSIIDVRELTKVRLVQRDCVRVAGAQWGTASAITSDLDQAHKMIGMFSDAQANVVTVPVYYYAKSPATDWWYYSYQTAVGIMSWDLSKYDDTKSETEQTVLQNHGTFTHPNGQVLRTIVYNHPVTKKRSMINLSDTHASLVDMQDLDKPTQQSIIELAPYYSEIYRFGEYLVEHVQSKTNSSQEPHEFRVRKPMGGTSGPIVASFSLGQVQRVVRQGNNLVLFGNIQSSTGSSQQTALVYDLSKPQAPRKAGQIVLTAISFPYYYYYCGWAPYGGYWFTTSTDWIATQSALHFVQRNVSYTAGSYATTVTLNNLDLANPDLPALTQKSLDPIASASYYYYDYQSGNLVGDAADSAQFYLTTRTFVGQVQRGSYNVGQYRYFAQRVRFENGAMTFHERINLPGTLVNTWKDAKGERFFLTKDTAYDYTNSSYQSSIRMYYLHEITRGSDKAAELVDGASLAGLYPQSLVREGDLLLLTARSSNYNATTTALERSDQLLIFDLKNFGLSPTYHDYTGTQNMRIMATKGNRAFVNLQGDGIVIMDLSKPAAPIGKNFLRTLGYATHLENIGDDVFVASGYFGLEHLATTDAPNLSQI